MNVLGDSFGAGIVEHLSRNDLEGFLYLDEGAEPHKVDPITEEFKIDPLNGPFSDKKGVEKEGYDNASFTTSL